MLIKTFFVVVCTLFVLFVSAQQRANCYMLGIYNKNENGKTGICSDRGFMLIGARNYNQFDSLRNKFFADYSKLAPGVIFIDSGKAAIIYKYVKHVPAWNCDAEIVTAISGKSIEECKALLKQKTEKHPEDYKTQPDIFQVIYTNGKGYKDFEEEYDGVVAQYKLITNVDGSIKVFVKLKNTNTKGVAHVAMIEANSKSLESSKEILYETKLQPGGTANVLLDKPNVFATEVKINTESEEVESGGIIKWIKDYVRSIITIENCYMKNEKSITAIGPRG